MAKKKLALTIGLVVLIAAALTLTLVFTLHVNGTAFATELKKGSSESGTTTVTYTVDDTWTVSIPDSLTIEGTTGEGSDTVTASGVKIEKDSNLKVTVDSENNWLLQNEGKDKSIGYELSVDSGSAFDKQTGNDVLSVAAGSDGGSANLKAKIKEDDKKYSTGNEAYTDTLTFNVTVA